MRRLVVLLVLVLVAVVAVLLWAVVLDQAPSPPHADDPAAIDESGPDEDTSVESRSDATTDVDGDRPRTSRHTSETDEPAAEEVGRRLRVTVLDEAGSLLEGIAVACKPAPLVVTDERGVADLGELPARVLGEAGGRVELQVITDVWTWDPVVHVVEVAPGAGDATAELRLPTSVLPVIVLRLQPEVPRTTQLRLRFPPAPVNYGRVVVPGRDTVRIPLHPPRRDILRIETVCPGFENAYIEIEAPRELGDHVVELPLVQGGVAAFGQVVEADGSAAADVVVTAYAGRDPEHVVRTLRTDDEGRFPIEPAMLGHSLLARRIGESCSQWVDLDDDTPADIVLTLGPGATIHGKVTEEDGTPAENALVWVNLVPKVDRKFVEETRTDAEGHYRVSGLPEGWWVRPTLFWHAPYSPVPGAPSPFYVGSREAALEKDEARITGGEGWEFERDLEAVRYPGADYAFRLVFPDAAELPETVTASGDGWSRVWALDPETRTVDWHLESGERHDIRFVAGHWIGRATGLVVEDRVNRTVDVVMERRTRVFVQVMDESGDFALRSGLTIDVATADESPAEEGFPDTESLGEVATDETGRAEITAMLPTVSKLQTDLDAKTVYDVRLVVRGDGLLPRNVHEHPPDWVLPTPEVIARLSRPEDWVIEVQPRAAPVVELEVVDANARPLAGERLRIDGDVPVVPDEVVTDASGLARIQVLTDIQVDEIDESVITFLDVYRMEVEFEVLQAVRTGRFRVVRPAVRQVELRALYPDGEPIAGLRLVNELTTLTDADGRMTLTLPTGDAGITVQPFGHERRYVEIPAELREVELRLEPLLSVWVFVHAPGVEGQRARVFAETLDGTRVAGMGSSDLRSGEAFTHMGLPAEELLIRVFTEDKRWGATVRRLPDQEEVHVHLVERQPQPVRVRILGPDGEPLRDTQVVFGTSGSASSSTTNLVTDATGELALELYGDRYQLSASRNRVGAGGVRVLVEDHRPPEEVIVIRLR